MSLPPPEYESFKIRFRQALDAQGMSVYRLARLLDPDNPEGAERNIRRWLSPSSTHMPSLASRLALARALGVDESFFDPRPGAEQRAKIARAEEQLDLTLLRVAREVWCPPDGPFGGYYLERELVTA